MESMATTNGKRKSHHLVLDAEEHSVKRQEISKEPTRNKGELFQESVGTCEKLVDTSSKKKDPTDTATSTDTYTDTGTRTTIKSSSAGIDDVQRDSNELPAKQKSRTPPVDAHHSVLPLSMQLMKPFWSMNCMNCSTAPIATGTRFSSLYDTGPRYHSTSTPSFIGKDGKVVGECNNEEQQIYCSPIWYETKREKEKNDDHDQDDDDVFPLGDTVGKSLGTGKDELFDTKQSSVTELRKRRTENVASTSRGVRGTHLEYIPPSPKDHTLPILQEYMTSTQMYGCRHVNPGVLTAFRFSLPTLRVSGSFHDSDMLALAEILFRHCNGALSHIRRLDFSIAGRYGKLHGRKGFGSHGAFTLSRVLCISKYVEEVFVQRNKIGPYGAAAIFAAASKNRVLKTIDMRRCGIGEKGALAFVEHVGKSGICGLKDVDLSVNGIGFRGSILIEEMLIERERKGYNMDVDLEGNLVLQEGKLCLTERDYLLLVCACLF